MPNIEINKKRLYQMQFIWKMCRNILEMDDQTGYRAQMIYLHYNSTKDNSENRKIKGQAPYTSFEDI